MQLYSKAITYKIYERSLLGTAGSIYAIAVASCCNINTKTLVDSRPSCIFVHPPPPDVYKRSLQRSSWVKIGLWEKVIQSRRQQWDLVQLLVFDTVIDAGTKGDVLQGEQSTSRRNHAGQQVAHGGFHLTEGPREVPIRWQKKLAVGSSGAEDSMEQVQDPGTRQRRERLVGDQPNPRWCILDTK